MPPTRLRRRTRMASRPRVLLRALKVQERIALKVEGGRLRKLVVEADAYGRVRGYVAVPDAVG